MNETRPGKDAAVAALKEMAKDAREGKLEIPGHNGEPHVVSTPEEAQEVLKADHPEMAERPSLKIIGADMAEEGDHTAVAVVDKRSESGDKKVVKLSRQAKRREHRDHEKKQEALRKLMNRPATMGALAQMGDDVKRNFGALADQSSSAVKIGQDCWRSLDILREFLISKGLATEEEFTTYFTTSWDRKVAEEKRVRELEAARQKRLAEASGASQKAAIKLSDLREKRNPLAPPEEIKEAEKELERSMEAFQTLVDADKPPEEPPATPEPPEKAEEGKPWK